MNNSRRHESNAFFVKGGTDIIRVIIINKREEKWEKKNWKKNQIKPSKKRGTKQERERWETSPYKSTTEQKWSPQSYESTTTEFPNHRQIQKENHERARRWSFQLICSLMESNKASRHAPPHRNYRWLHPPLRIGFACVQLTLHRLLHRLKSIQYILLFIYIWYY